MSRSTWIILTLVCIAIQSFFSMIEMAIVSFNKVRLQHYVSRGSRRARWVRSLLSHPARLFGTTLLGVNIMLQVGSQCSREVYIAFNLNPDIAPLTQVFLVLIFAELSPMFAARRYAESVAMLGIPILYTISILLRPLIWILGAISATANWLFGGSSHKGWSLLSREELQHLVAPGEEENFDLLVKNIFELRSKRASDAMVPMHSVHSISARSSVGELRQLLRRFDVPCVPLYDNNWRHIVAIAFPRDLVRAENEKPLRDLARIAWFIPQGTPIVEILSQFRRTHEQVAIVIDDEGRALGLVSLEDVLEEIFGEDFTRKRTKQQKRRDLIERTLPANMLLADFNAQFGTQLRGGADETLAQVIAGHLGHPPERGESVRIGNFEFTITETTLLGVKTLVARTIQ